MDDHNWNENKNTSNPNSRMDSRPSEPDRTEHWNGNGAYESAARSRIDHRLPVWFVKSQISIRYVLGVVETLLLFRFLFRLLGANPASGFVSFVYSITGFLVAPFFGIFNSYVSGGLVAKSIFEPAVIIAMLVYAIAAWGLVNLLRLKAHRDG